MFDMIAEHVIDCVCNASGNLKERYMQLAIYRFEFSESASMTEVESTLHLAIAGAEGLFGEASVLMDGAYSIDEQRRTCVVDARNDVGRSICQLFTGYLRKELRDRDFTVRPCDTPPDTHATCRTS